MKILFAGQAWDDYLYSQKLDRKILARINTLIEATTRDPFTGIGKPEPLKHHLKGWWSRRITEEHRMVHRSATNGSRSLSCDTTTEAGSRPGCHSY